MHIYKIFYLFIKKKNVIETAKKENIVQQKVADKNWP